MTTEDDTDDPVSVCLFQHRVHSTLDVICSNHAGHSFFYNFIDVSVDLDEEITRHERNYPDLFSELDMHVGSTSPEASTFEALLEHIQEIASVQRLLLSHLNLRKLNF